MSLKVGINGFGRIGRMVLRSIIENNRKDLEVVAINNRGNSEISSFLLKHDTIHGKLKAKISHSEKQIEINGKKISLIRESEISKIDWKNLNKFTKEKFDWVWACPTETSLGLRIPIIELKKFAKKTNSKLALDATASIGLEKDHKLADVVSFSSCKGLFGLTGASFICYKKKPANKVNSFVLNIKNLEQKKMTGPIHTIQSLEQILKKYNHFKKSVINNKKRMLLKFKKYLVYSKKNQPLLCTFVNKKIVSKNKNVILYKPRLNINGSVVCHLGEVHLGKKAKGRILDLLKINE